MSLSLLLQVPLTSHVNLTSISNRISGSTCLIYVSAGTADFTCEPDEYALLVAQLKDSGIIKDQRRGLRSHKAVFTGRDFVDWVVSTKQLGE